MNSQEKHKFAKPNLEDLELSVEEDGSKRYITCWYQDHLYKVRIPLHIWNDPNEDTKSFLMQNYVGELITKIHRGRYERIENAN